MFLFRLLRPSTLLLLCAARLIDRVELIAADSDPARIELRGYVEAVTLATASRFGAADSANHGMDGAKIIANPNVNGQFIAVYHTYAGGSFRTHLATSTDLLNWTWIRELAGSSGSASQPTIKASGAGFVMAWEQENPGGGGNHVKLAYFTSWANLQNGVVNKSYDAPMVFSICANGTPNLYAASSSSCDVGFHYFKNCDVDRQARATTNWSNWTATVQTNVDNAVLFWGVTGNIGDRDGMSGFQGYNFGLIEGQFTKGNFGTWSCYLYDYQTGNSDKLTMQTPGGSVSFGNPTMEMVAINGRPAVLATMFLFSEGIRGSDRAGELIYYRYFNFPLTTMLPIAASADDAEESIASGAVNLISSDLEMVDDPGTAFGLQTVGLRFAGLAIPQGAVVADARIQFAAKEAQSEATSLDIAAEAADSAAAFTAVTNNLGSRAITTTNVLWEPPAWNTVSEAGAAQKTANLAAIVQEIISRPGWASGNALGFLIAGTGHRTADSFDRSGGTPARLTVRYYLTSPPPASFAKWLTAYPSLTGLNAQLTANPDGDAFNNLLEYALATNPAQSNAAPYTVGANGGKLFFTYNRPSLAPDIVYALEWSDTLAAGNWSASGIAQQVLGDDGTTRMVRASVAAGAGRRFLRLKITMP